MHFGVGGFGHSFCAVFGSPTSCICQPCSEKGHFLWQHPLHSDQQLLLQLEQLCLTEDAKDPSKNEMVHEQSEDAFKKRSNRGSGSALQAHIVLVVGVRSVSMCLVHKYHIARNIGGNFS